MMIHSMRYFATAATVAIGVAAYAGAQAQQQQQSNGNTSAQNHQQQYPQLQRQIAQAQRQHVGIPLLPAADIVNRPLVDRNGRSAGHIQSLIIDSNNGVVEYVIVAGGGGFNLSGDFVAIPWSVLSQPTDHGPIALKITDQQLANAPRINPNELRLVGGPGWRNRVYGFWGVPYPYYRSWAWYGRRGPNRTAGNNGGTTGSGNSNGNFNNAHNGNSGNANNNSGNANNNGNMNANSGNNGHNNNDNYALAVNGNGVVSRLENASSVQPNELRAATVWGQDGTWIGNINEVMIDTRSGHVAYVLIKRGGFLGLNPVWYPVPLEALRWMMGPYGVAANCGNGNNNNNNSGNNNNNCYRRPYAGGYGPGYYGGWGWGYGGNGGYGLHLTVNTQALNHLPPVPVNTSNLNLTRYAPMNDLALLYHDFGIQPYWTGNGQGGGTTGMGSNAQ